MKRHALLIKVLVQSKKTLNIFLRKEIEIIRRTFSQGQSLFKDF